MAPFIILTGIGILMIIAYLIVDGMKQKGRNPEEWKDEAEIRSIRRHQKKKKNNKTQPADDTSLKKTGRLTHRMKSRRRSTRAGMPQFISKKRHHLRSLI